MNAQQNHHVVVGDGVVALEFVALAQLSAGDRLSVIGPNVDRLGRGVAYADEAKDAQWRYAFLLNSPCEGVDPDFVPWLESRWSWVESTLSGGRPDWMAAAQGFVDRGDIGALNLPRQIFGDYLQDRATATLNRLRGAGVRVDLIADHVEDIQPEEQGYVITTRGGRRLVAHSVDIATGGPSNQRIAGDDTPNSFAQLVGFEGEIAKLLRPGVSVCCIGSNATMLDVLRLCQTMLPEDQFRFSAVSPEGKLPRALVASMPRNRTEPDLGGPYSLAEDFVNRVRSEMDRAFDAGHSMAQVRSGFRRHFIDHGLMKYVPDMDQARRVPPAIKSWLLGGTRDSIEDFHRLAAKGITKTIPARARHIHRTPRGGGGATVHLRGADGSDFTHNADVVINCAGPGRAFLFDPFTRSLIDRGWISICPISNGVEIGEHCQTTQKGVRYLSAATTVIGREVMPYPLYDTAQLRHVLQRCIGPDAKP